MTRQQFAQAIQKCFSEVYGSEYTGPMKINKLKDGFEVELGFNLKDYPLRIAAQLGEDDFIEYFKKEIKNRHFTSSKYYHVSRVSGNICHKTN